MHVLDEPVWTALTTHHNHLAIGGGAALRYPPDISPLAAVLTDDTASLLQLSSLFAPGETIVMVRKAPVAMPPGFAPVTMARLVQMVAIRSFDLSADPRVERLTSVDEDQIYDLATLARPGPFARHTMRLGEFWGIKQDGRLVAMAGERLRQENWVELSGVCVEPGQRGQGYARLLSSHVTARIADRGEKSYLHCLESNEPAISLYRSLGYEIRATMNVIFAVRTDEEVR